MVMQTNRREKSALDQPPVDFVERDEIELAAAQVAHHTLEEIRCHLQQAVGLERLGPLAAAHGAR